MPRDASGNYTLPGGNPVTGMTTISSTWANTTLTDVGTAMTGSLARNGDGGMTGQFKGASGNTAAPGIAFASETTAGWYRAGAGDFRFAIGGVDVFNLTAAGAVDYAKLSANNAWTGTNRYSQGVQVTGTGTTGFAGVGVELFSTGSIGGLQAYNRTGAAYVPLSVGGNTVDLKYGASQASGLVIGSAGNVTVNAPTSGTAFTVSAGSAGPFALLSTGGVNVPAARLVGTATASTSYGLDILAGTNSTDAALRVYNAASSPLLTVNGVGALGLAGGVVHTVGGSNFLAQSGSTNFMYTGTSGMTWRNQADSATNMSLTNGGNLTITGGYGTNISGANVIAYGVLGAYGFGVDGGHHISYNANDGTFWWRNAAGSNNNLVLDNSGNLTAVGNVTAFSDIRLKKDIVSIFDALGKVLNLRGVSYTRIDSGERQTGLIAQEVMEVLPEAVRADTETGYLSVAYGNLTGLLVEAIKALEYRVRRLE